MSGDLSTGEVGEGSRGKNEHPLCTFHVLIPFHAPYLN